MRYYYDLDEFYATVKGKRKGEIRLYKATPALDRAYAEECSPLWLLEKMYGENAGTTDFASYEEAKVALDDHFYAVVADYTIGW